MHSKEFTFKCNKDASMKKESLNPIYRNGIEVRPNKDGIDRFRVRIRKKGQKEISHTYRTETLAKKNKCRIESEIESALTDFKLPGKQMFSDLVDRYIETILRQNPKNARNKRAHLMWWNERFKHLRLRDIKPNLIAQSRDELLTKKTKQQTIISPTTVVRYLSTLSHAFSIAVKEWEWTSENPVLKVKKPQPAKGRLRFLSLDEKDRLLAACKTSKSKDLYLIVALAISTGMRRGEILNLKWKNIDFETNAIWLEETKNGEQRHVPLIGVPLDLLKSKYEAQEKESLVFANKKSSTLPICIRKAWENSLNKSGIDDCVFHSLRHTTASYLAMEHASLIEIAALLGHKTLQATKRYAHLSDRHLQQTAITLQSKIFN